MWNKIRNSRLSYILLSVLLSVVCWLYVDLAQQPDAQVTINSIPVTFIGEENLESEGLLITGETPTINVVVKGPRSIITQLNNSNIIVTATTASITEAGVYTLDLSINLPSSVTSSSSSDVSIVSRSASAVDVTVVQMVSKTVTITPEFTGSVADGYYSDDESFVLQQKELEIRGEESVVDSVSYAKVILSDTGLTDTWSGWLSIVLCDKDGNEVSTDDLTLETEAISVTYYVQCIRELTLTVDLISGGGATSENAECTYSVESVTVVGQSINLDDLETLTVGEVDLGQIATTGEYEFSIEDALPDGVSLMSNETTVKVQVTITGLEIRIVSTSNIVLENKTDGWNYQVANVEIRLRGKTEDFDLLINDDIQVTVDLEGVELVDGETVSVPATVELSGVSDLGILGSYNVSVTTTLIQEETTEEETTDSEEDTTEADSDSGTDDGETGN
ncbi:MAG: hypothetical protein LUC30_10080 [Clostridiales bacterium]|nr:hypothetical protein [Clostridiales bacterium]